MVLSREKQTCTTSGCDVEEGGLGIVLRNGEKGDQIMGEGTLISGSENGVTLLKLVDSRTGTVGHGDHC